MKYVCIKPIFMSSGRLYEKGMVLDTEESVPEKNFKPLGPGKTHAKDEAPAMGRDEIVKRLKVLKVKAPQKATLDELQKLLTKAENALGNVNKVMDAASFVE